MFNKTLLVLAVLSLSSCGIDAHVNGHVDTSGTVTIKLDYPQIIAFFKYDCEVNVNKGDFTVDQCVSSLTSEFSNFIANNTGTK